MRMALGKKCFMYFFVLVYLTGTMHTNKHVCKCARFSQKAITHLWSLGTDLLQVWIYSNHVTTRLDFS